MSVSIGKRFFTVGTPLWGEPCQEVEDRLPDGGHTRLRWWSADPFFPSRCSEAAGLEKRVGDHAYQGVAVQPDPGPPFEMVEPQFFLELLMGLLTDPSGLDRRSQRLEARLGR